VLTPSAGGVSTPIETGMVVVQASVTYPGRHYALSCAASHGIIKRLARILHLKEAIQENGALMATSSRWKASPT